MKKLNLLLICLIFIICSSYAQLTPFEISGYDYFPVTGRGNWHVLVDDLNSDGYEDLYITREAQKDIMFYGNANGTFTSVDITGVPWNNFIGSLGIISLDLNGDGLKELIITRTPYTGGSTEALGAKDKILKNLGGGNFQDVSNNLPTDFYNILISDMDAVNYTTGVAYGLLNEDTIPDIVMVNGGVSYLPIVTLFNSLGFHFNPINPLFLFGSPQLGRDKLKNDLYFSTGTDGNGDGIDNYANAPSLSPVRQYSDMSTDVVVAFCQRNTKFNFTFII